jgi:putative membrane protein (TIGR04086 family)|nr:TIGR04086 family membrane protein [Chloroflexus aurantiacus]
MPVNIRWTAVISGFMTDFALTILLQVFIVLIGQTTVFTDPSLQNPIHIVLILIGAGLTGVGGFVAAWLAGESFAMHGFLVGVVGILVAALANVGVVVPPLLLLGQVVGCICGALGGVLAGRLRTSVRIK